jgi:hypothetical protein
MTAVGTPVRKGISRFGRGRAPAAAVATLLLLWWCGLVLGPDLPVLLLVVTGTLVAVWMVRHRPAAAACAGIAAGTATVFAVTCVVVVDRQSGGATEVVAVLIGYLLVAPIPALAACLQRPVSLVSAPVSTLVGSGILLASATPTVLAGGGYGLDSVVLVTGLVTAVAMIVLRHRRAAAKLTDPLPTLHGWTDLGGRRAPDDTRIDRLLLGAGHAIVGTRLVDDQPVTDRVALAAVRQAAAAAQAVGLPPHRVQPVILTTTAEKDSVRRCLVNDGDVAAAVIIARPDQLCRVIAQAPARRPGHRRAVLAAALLPTIPTPTRERVG